MARTIKSKRKQVKRRNATKSALPKILIGAGVLGGGYLLYTKVIKPYMQAGKDTTDQTPTTDTESAINTTVNAANNTTANVTSASAGKTFSPLGTPVDKLDLNTNITFGSKGEEVKRMQDLINAGLKNFGSNLRVPMTGTFDTATWNVHKQISFNAIPLKTWINWYNESKKQAGTTSGTTSNVLTGQATAIGFTTAGLPGAAVGALYDWMY